ncbi:hypothetical protein CP8484711_0343B, partial [Chlamydia psittaci 84-8471/1]
FNVCNRFLRFSVSYRYGFCGTPITVSYENKTSASLIHIHDVTSFCL